MPRQCGARFTEEDHQRVAELHALGKGRNAIAREIDRARRTVSVIAAELGLTFDVSMTEDAARARVAQLAALRADAAVGLHLDGMKLAQRMGEPALIYNFGGKDNACEDREVDEPPAIDKKED